MLAIIMFSGNEPLRDALREVVLGGMLKHRIRPEGILIRDERLFKALEPACSRMEVALQQVDTLVAAPDALKSLADHMRGGPR